ncbi:MAG TPA: hypothetical protein VFY29_04245 [Terriglobia bacterium]|nr:hypothetical protein [Terriglobia bacterium]
MKFRLFVFRVVLVAVALFGAMFAGAQLQASGDTDIIAIGIALQPEPALARYADTINAELRENYPSGYTLEGSRAPQVTLVQRYIRASDLPAVAASVAQVIREEHPTTLQLTANSYAIGAWAGLGVMALHVDPMPDLRRFERKVVAVVQPFAVTRGTAQAFAVSTDGLAVNQDVLIRVERYVPDYTGRNLTINMIVGMAQTRCVKEIMARPFEPFTFGVSGVLIYQVGPNGEPQRALWTSNPDCHGCAVQ